MPLYPNPITAGGDLTGNFPNPTIATYRTITRVSTRILASIVTGAATFITVNGGTILANPTANGNYALFYLDPTAWARTGMTTQCQVTAGLLCNDVAPTITYTWGLYPVTAIAGATTTLTLTLGAVVSGSTVAHTTPAANSLTAETSSGAFTFPSAGFYILGVASSGAAAANANGHGTVSLQVRNV